MLEGRCPHCDSRNVHMVDPLRRGTALPLAPGSIAWLTYYVCVACGYTEQYIYDPLTLEDIARHWPRIGPGAPGDPGATQRLPPPDGETQRL